MKNSCKIRIMENFVSIDYICFGDLLKQVHNKTDRNIKEYMELKGALCSILSELYNFTGFNPGMPKVKFNSTMLYEQAKSNAVIARKNSKLILESAGSKKHLQLKVGENIEQFPENDTNDTVDFTIHEKAIQIALDNLLIARSLTENDVIEKMQSFEGVMFEDAYKIIRDSLVEKAIEIINA